MNTLSTPPSYAAVGFKDQGHRVVVGTLWFLIILLSIVGLTRYRLLPHLFLLFCTYLWFKRPHLRRARFLALVLLGFLAMELLLPFDISILYRPGRPRIMRLLMGLPGPRAWEAAERGEVVLGGCVVTGNEPHWTLVW